MDADIVTAHEHELVGRRAYRAIVDVLDEFDDDGLADVTEQEAWFDTLDDAGAWVDHHAADRFDGRVEEHVWCETVTVDEDAKRVTYSAARQPTGRFLERLYYQDPDSGAPYARWSCRDHDDHADQFPEHVWPEDETWWDYDPDSVANPWRPRPTGIDSAIVHRDLVTALRAAWQLCQRLRNPYEPDLPTGINVPEQLRHALEVVAAEVGGAEELVRHRPGSWEADHVRNLAALITFAP